VPLPVAPSALLPEPGSVYTHHEYGLPLLVMRDSEGVVRIFLNACRHRGTRLIEAAEPVAKRSVSCPYHAWNYRLDGCLRSVPFEETFTDLDKSALGLVELPAAELGGMIWVRLDRHDTSGFDEVAGELAEDLDAFGLGGLHLYRRGQHDVATNWKLIQDGFVESYHVTFLHSKSVGKMFEQSVNVENHLGDHKRFATARKGFADGQVALDERADLDTLRKSVTYSFNIFPAATIVVSPDFVNVLIFYPQAADRTIVEDFMLIPEAPADERAERHWRRSWDLLDGQVYAAEDLKMCEWQQQGLASGAITETMVGGLELPIRSFHDSIERRIAESTK
jgi:phenylpropionate dioxygenase-like ring-hydroxylating dioxygenase large terminal subunit